MKGGKIYWAGVAHVVHNSNWCEEIYFEGKRVGLEVLLRLLQHLDEESVVDKEALRGWCKESLVKYGLYRESIHTLEGVEARLSLLDYKEKAKAKAKGEL